MVSAEPSLVVYQAIYGERNGAHALLSTTDAPHVPFASFAPLTDLPDNVPANVLWTPYLGGFVRGPWYVLTRTAPDPSAARTGMVRTHLLAIELAALQQQSDLEPLVGLFGGTLTTTVDRKPINVSRTQSEAHERPGENAFILTPGEESSQPSVARSRAAVHALVRALLELPLGSSQPIVWLGQDGFDEAMLELWRRLSPSLRATFQFRLSLSPQDSGGQGLTVVSTPAPLENRWHDAPLIRPAEQADTALTPAEAYLLGAADGAQVAAFIAALEWTPSQFRDLRLVERALPYWRGLEEGTIPDGAVGIRGLATVIDMLSPEPTTAVGIKRRLLSLLMRETISAASADVLGLRALNLGAFPQGEDMVAEGVFEWLLSVASDDRRAREENHGATVLATATTGDSAWTRAVRRAAEEFLRRWPRGAASTAWAWWQAAPVLVSTQERVLPAGAENSLATETPTAIPPATGRNVRAVATRRTWPLLHAAAAAASLSPLEAWRVEVEAPTRIRTPQAYRLLAERLPAWATVDAAVTAGDAVLTDIAAERCAAEPSLMAGLDPTHPGWQALWARAAARTGNVWNGIQDPAAFRDHLLGAIVAGAEVREDLLVAIAHSQHGSLLDEPIRDEVWECLSRAARAAFLAATADAWCDRYVSGEDDGRGLERPLEEAICESGRLKRVLMHAEPGSVGRGAGIFRRFPTLPEQHFESWVTELAHQHRAMSAMDAIVLGELVVERRWRGGAGALASAARSSADFTPAVVACYEMLGWIEKFTLGILGRSKRALTGEELWDALLELCAVLRPGGPEEEHVWTRAKGDPSLLPYANTGRARWSVALHVLRNGGGGGKISLHRLFEVLRRDFPKNAHLESLERHMTNGR
jgi:hypothetical protein